ncbi:hypothetical protein EDB92DRAFT_1818210 [Lactarius akahatsu]|uniref:Uncharacterized protein n=1 Tax=Lactarius akahatsu TaxID=416441 RepID=A0AAD4LFN4_9AGAM|nr:hypothetical protein EDB92DRAFT_1818210 [Lactarius akahatsu]
MRQGFPRDLIPSAQNDVPSLRTADKAAMAKQVGFSCPFLESASYFGETLNPLLGVELGRAERAATPWSSAESASVVAVLAYSLAGPPRHGTWDSLRLTREDAIGSWPSQHHTHVAIMIVRFVTGPGAMPLSNPSNTLDSSSLSPFFPQAGHSNPQPAVARVTCRGMKTGATVTDRQHHNPAPSGRSTPRGTTWQFRGLRVMHSEATNQFFMTPAIIVDPNLSPESAPGVQ